MTMIGIGGAIGNALALSAIGMAVAVILSARSNSQAYIVIFGISIFAAIVVWILILVTHFVFRHRRTLGLPASPVKLAGAPLTSGLSVVFLTAALVSTYFVPGLDPAWQFGAPFFVVLLLTYAVLRRRSTRSDAKNLLTEEQDRRRDRQELLERAGHHPRTPPASR